MMCSVIAICQLSSLFAAEPVTLTRFGERCCAVNSDGSVVATCISTEKQTTIEIWSTSSGMRISKLTLPSLEGSNLNKMMPTMMQFCRQGKYLAIGKLRRWYLLRLDGHRVSVVLSSAVMNWNSKRKCCGAFAFSEDSSLFACGGFGVTVWQLQKVKEVGRIELPKNRFCDGLAVLPKGGEVAIASKIVAATKKDLNKAHDVELWSWKKKRVIDSFQPMNGQIKHMKLSPDRKLLVAVAKQPAIGSGAFITVWDVSRRTRVKQFKVPARNVSCIAFSRDGKAIGAGSFGGEVAIWNTQSWKRSGSAKCLAKLPVWFAFGSKSCSKVVAITFDIRSVELFDTQGKTKSVRHLRHP